MTSIIARLSSCRAVVVGVTTWLALLAIPAVSQSGIGLGFTGDQDSSLVDSMYVKGLRFLMRSQNPDGSFSGQYGSNPAIAGFCLMSVLAHGDDPQAGEYAPMVKKCLDLIIRNQDHDGYIGDTMYDHGFATLALAEAYGAVRDDRVGPALRKAVTLILTAQENNPLKAWRYQPTANDADTSVTGCQIVALFAARNAGIPVSDAAINNALKYLASCRSPEGAYGYMNNRTQLRVTLTSIGLLALSLNRQKDEPSYAKSLEYLTRRINHRDEQYPYYLEYYMSQALFHADQETWRKWNARNIRYMRVTQSPDGSWLYGHTPAYSTSLALLSLALNYRFLPIYEQ